ncbi:MAG TPA: hypothetical protein VFD87_10530 [Phototrophicaceae bacterium]|nr:hypothetical protein [Phototrophicaceae bacterium]
MLRCVGQMPGFSSAGTALLVYFNSADCAVEAARVVKADGVPGAGKFSIGEYRLIALAIDTEGNMFGLHSM